jgi:Xaa-Pro aminopeptidase
MSIFSRDEIERRMDRFRAQLGACDAGVVFSFTNSYYLSGVPVIPWGRPTITIVPKDAAPAIILFAGEKERARAHSPISDIRVYVDGEGPNPRRAVVLLAELLERRGLRHIGFDAANTPVAMLETLKSLSPETRFTDLSEVLDALRLVSSEQELVQLRSAAAIVDLGMTTYLEEADIGRPEVVLAGRALLAMSEFAAHRFPDAEVRVHCYSQQGLRSLQPHTAANGDPLAPGQLMCIVVEAHVWHYQAAVERAVALGELSAEQETFYDTIITAQRKAIEAVGPGVRCSDVDRAGRQVFEAAGFTGVHCGAGLARGVLSEWEGRIDSGNLRAYNETPLLPNIVLTIEPWASAPGLGAPRHCDMVRVTETGREVMTTATSGAIRIG